MRIHKIRYVLKLEDTTMTLFKTMENNATRVWKDCTGKGNGVTGGAERKEGWYMHREVADRRRLKRERSFRKKGTMEGVERRGVRKYRRRRHPPSG